MTGKSTFSIRYDGTGYYRVSVYWRSGVVTELSIHFRAQELALEYMSRHYPNLEVR